ncbi:MAG: polymerase gamma and tau subunit [Actinomycetota bacterium]
MTDPLRAALRNNRVNHAYLFSGPRGCGKTTSARILARCLNCAEGPTDTPCGKCPSCVELSRDGSGSIDVIEIDAASHNGVDDARDLRERAGFAPSRDRYKIYILDEAHMVTSQGFNALLKIVEEPPEHVKFIFATTEPDKVIGTIRSRTHHYPFRLVPPAVMLDYVNELCQQEKVTVEDGVLPLVIRAGGGSVRDTLSLLDQIIAGSDNATVTRERTNNLLGYTPNELLDECIEAIGRDDAALAFAVVDRIIQTGNDPRRFVEDVLERFRDLVIVDATGDGAAAVLRGVPADEIERMAGLAVLFGASALSCAADIVNEALSNMTGTTPPRIHLELMVARLLVDGDGAEPVERPARPAASAPATPAAPVQTTPSAPVTAPVATTEPAVEPVAAAEPVAPVVAAPVAAEPVAHVATTPVATSAAESGSLEELVEIWPDILEELKSNPGVWVVVNASTPTALVGDVLTLEFADQMFLDRFKEQSTSGKAVFEELREAIVGALGVRFRFTPRVGMAAGPITAQTPRVATPETNPFMAEAEAAKVDRGGQPAAESHVASSPAAEVEAPTKPVEPVAAAEPVATKKPEEEKVGESVIRDVLGATLVATIENGNAADEPSNSDNVAPPPLFDDESDSDD